jgi:hypothetical protein
MISDDAMTRLRLLVSDLQDAATHDDVKDSDQEGKLWSAGFDDGQIQAGNDLEALLDDLSGVERRPDA